VPVIAAVVVLGGVAAVFAAGDVPIGDSARTSTVRPDQDTAPAPEQPAAGLAGSAIPSDPPTISTAPLAGPSASPSSAVPKSPAATSAAPTGRANKSGANLALHKTTDASSLEGPGYPASAAVDGNLETRWSSGFADPQWIRVDLGAVWSISDVRLRWEHAHAVKYRVDVSLDGRRWTTVYRTSAGTDGVRDIGVDPAVPARYVRVYGTKRSSQYGYSLLELEVR
jgi:hypothetical protein